MAEVAKIPSSEMKLRNIRFEDDFEINAKFISAKYTYKKLENKSTTLEEQKQCIRDILHIYKTNISENEGGNPQAGRIIFQICSKYRTSNGIKEYLRELLSKSKLGSDLVQDASSEVMSNINNNATCNIKDFNGVVSFISLMHNTPNCSYDDTVPFLLPMYIKLFEAFVYHARLNFVDVKLKCDLFDLMDRVFPEIMQYFVNVTYKRNETLLKKSCVQLILLSHTVITCGTCPFHLRKKCGLIMVHCFRKLPDNLKKSFRYKDYPILDLLKDFNFADEITLGNYTLSTISDVENVVIICASIQGTLPQVYLNSGSIESNPIGCLLFRKLLDYGHLYEKNTLYTTPYIGNNFRLTNTANAVIEISSSLHSLAMRLLDIHQETVKRALYHKSLAFVNLHYDHRVDLVQNNTSDFLHKLVYVAHLNNVKSPNTLNGVLFEHLRAAAASSSHALALLLIDKIFLHHGPVVLAQNFPILTEYLLSIIDEPVISEKLYKTYNTLLESYYHILGKESWMKKWVMPVIKAVGYCNCLDQCEKIIIKAFDLYRPIIKLFYVGCYEGNTQKSIVLLKCLRHARIKYLETEIKSHEESGNWRGLVHKDIMMKLAVNQSDEVRVSALAVVVECRKSTDCFTEWELDYLKSFMRFNISCQVPGIRKQIITYYKKVLTRFRDSLYSTCKLLSKKKPEGEQEDEDETFLVLQKIQSSYDWFIDSFTRQLISYLTMDSNYYRRSVSLDLLISIEKIIPKEKWLSYWTERDVAHCHNMLMDNYESNKKMAMALFKTLPNTFYKEMDDATFHSYDCYLQMAEEIDPSRTLSAAYLLRAIIHTLQHRYSVKVDEKTAECKPKDAAYEVILVLSDRLKKFKRSTDLDQMNTSYYGILLCIRYILQSRDLSKNNETYAAEVFKNLVDICLTYVPDVMSVITAAAPEGYINENDLDDTLENVSKGHKATLYGWRAVKEMTLLFAELIKQAVKLEDTVEMLGEDEIKRICDVFYEIFIHGKHRGAVEKAYEGFCTVCSAFLTSKKKNLNDLPKNWLTTVVDICLGKKSEVECGYTRRSAGLAHFTLALLVTQKSNLQETVHEVMHPLLNTTLGTQIVKESSVIHCMNVMRMIFRNSKLSESTAQYIGDGVITVFRAFRHPSWEVRNSCSLLFGTLITRIFGVQRSQDPDNLSIKNKLTITNFELRYQKLVKNIRALMNSPQFDVMKQPLLIMFSRLYPSQFEKKPFETDFMYKQLIPITMNHNYKTRDLAARATVALISSDNLRHQLMSWIQILSNPRITDTVCQGYLLQMLYVIKTTDGSMIPVSEFLEVTINILPRVGRGFSHMTVKIYLDIVLLLLIKFESYNNMYILMAFLRALSKDTVSNLLPTTAMATYTQSRLLLILYLLLRKMEHCDVTYTCVTYQLMKALYDPSARLQRFCLYTFIYMNQVCNNIAEVHPLFQLEELEIPQGIIMVVNTFDKETLAKLLKISHPYVCWFLLEELKKHQYIGLQDQVLLYLLASLYPCVLRDLNENKEDTFNFMIDLCYAESNKNNEELISAVLSCIGTFMSDVHYGFADYEKLIQLLSECASPVASDFRRLAASSFLVQNYKLYCSQTPILRGVEHETVLDIVMVLLEDDDVVVRNKMSQFAMSVDIKFETKPCIIRTFEGSSWPEVAEKAREILLNYCYYRMPTRRLILFLVSWMCRHFPDTIKDEDMVFEHSELNVYAENVSFMDCCQDILNKKLWPLDDPYCRISIKEKTLFVTRYLLDVLSNDSRPMMLFNTKQLLLKALAKTECLCHVYEGNYFQLHFKRYLLNNFFTDFDDDSVSNNELDLVQNFVHKIYSPVLQYEV